MNEPVSRLILPNGTRVLVEKMPGSGVVSIGVWVDVGSRDETEDQGGVTHFVEHMLFKGTRRRDVFTLARDINRLGGGFNAYTSPEHLCLHATVVRDDIGPALGILAEMLLDSLFPEQEVENERGVILGEIADYEDQPEEVVEDKFFGALWPGHPLGRPIAGTRKAVGRLNRERLLTYWSERFAPDRLIVTLAGGVDRRRAASLVGRLFAEVPTRTCPPSPGRNCPVTVPGVFSEERDLEQVHFCLGVDGPSCRTPDRFALAVFNSLFGDGLGSRLSNEIRERRGLAYSIGSSFSPFCDTGCFAIRGSTGPDRFDEVLDLSLRELRSLFRTPPSEDEVAAARSQCIRGYLLALESAGARMTRLGENELVGMETLTPNEVVRRLEAVAPRTIQEVVERYLEGKKAAAALVGPVNGHSNRLRSLVFA